MIASELKEAGIYDANDMASIRAVVEAVCGELGIARDDRIARERIATHILRSWEAGQRTPLDLVRSGLGSYV